MRIFARVRDDGLRRRLDQTAGRLDAEVVDARSMGPEQIGESLRDESDIILVDADATGDIERLRKLAQQVDAALVLACPIGERCPARTLARTDEWVPADVGQLELALRLRTALERSGAKASWKRMTDAADLFRYEELLFDKRTGLPTLPLMIDQLRERLQRQSALMLIYIHFVWFSKIEEIFGWQKLDAVLETTADAMRDYTARRHEAGDTALMMSFSGDDDFVLFDDATSERDQGERRVRATTRRLEGFIAGRLKDEHGEDIANLSGVYVGTAKVVGNPKVSTERLIYRALRDAAQAARGVEQWERSHRVADLKTTLSEGAVFMEYHPIIVVATDEVYGYEALARGSHGELRSPEVLFEVADEANLVWELSRLLRRRAVEGIIDRLESGQLLFMNVDPHDFNDPTFRDLDAEVLGIDDPGRIVLEITERIAIRDYPRFQTYLAAFRERGFRFAVDDAGSGYAGLGSIANLAPDFIKLDISLISNIDSNFLKQNLVQTLVSFAEEHGAQVVAEGVERREEFETVRRIGVHLAQGFYFGRSLRAELPQAS